MSIFKLAFLLVKFVMAIILILMVLSALGVASFSFFWMWVTQ